jgi:flagellar assembly factor FliW
MTGTAMRHDEVKAQRKLMPVSPEAVLPPTLEVAGGLPPFVNAVRFTLTPETNAPPFFRIRCTTMDLSYVVIDPFIPTPDYAPEFSDADLTELGITADITPIVLAIVNFSRGAEEVTLNLTGPLLINPKTGKSKQVVLENATKYSTKHKLLGQ